MASRRCIMLYIVGRVFFESVVTYTDAIGFLIEQFFRRRLRVSV